jgi:hypothetical protein
MAKVKLIAGQGCDEANHGAERFRVNNDRSVTVCAEAVGPLVAIGGCVIADPPSPIEVPHGNVRLVNERIRPPRALTRASRTRPMPTAWWLCLSG